MGSDLLTLNALAKELDAALVGARIDKIQQPEQDELRFFMRSKGKNVCLVASCNAQIPRLHLTVSKKQSPQVAPNFCMLLRKHLAVASVDSVGIFNQDRIIFIKFNAKTELGDDTNYYLFAELMNRYSNLVFTDENLKILEATKHIPLDAEREHIVMRGVKYSPVPQRKTSYLNGCNDVLHSFEGGDLRKHILDSLSGFSGATVTEILFRAGILENTQKLTEEQISAFENALFSMTNESSPCAIGKDVYPVVYKSISRQDNTKYFSTLSEAFDCESTEIDAEVRNRSRLKSLSAQVKRLKARAEKNIAIDLENLKDCEDMERYRIFGELIVANIYKINRGDTVLKCTNYYDGSEVEIPLDQRLSPSKNSAFYYNKYNKLKRTKEYAEKKLTADRDFLDYILSVEEEIASLPFDASLSPIEEELASLGGVVKKAKKGKVRKEQAEPPYVYLVDGFYIYRGKNNYQNEELTFKIASSNDLWLHLKNAHGAHIIILAEGRKIPDKVLKIALEIAASTAGASVDVDYTLRRFVKRKPGGHPGQVIYTDFKTAHVSPDAHTEFLIKK